MPLLPPGWALGELVSEEAGWQLTLGGVAGFCSGYAAKKVGRAAALAAGLAFIGVQLARARGVVAEPDWTGVNGALVAALDADGDGRVTAADLRAHGSRLVAVLGFNVPGGAAFTTAFLLGLKVG